MSFELVRCNEGDRWFPWNYGRKSPEGRIGIKRFAHEPGLVVINATTSAGRVLGSCSLRVGYRHSEYLLSDEEYQYGALAAGPAYFWRDDQSCPWILVLKSFWVRPDVRRNGIARRFAAYARDIGLPTYLAFANKHVKAWFDRQFSPTDEASPLQAKIVNSMSAPGESDSMPDRDADFTVFVQAQAPALLLWHAWPGISEELVGLDKALLFPDRADEPHGASEEDYEAAESTFALQSHFTAGSVDGWIIDSEAMCAYASVRHFLRTLTWQDYDDINDAAQELFVRDLRDEPRGLSGFSALASPVSRPSK